MASDVSQRGKCYLHRFSPACIIFPTGDAGPGNEIEWVLKTPRRLGMIDESAENNMEAKSTSSSSMAANSSPSQNETGGNQHELPPPYSAMPQYQVENPAVVHNPTVQQQNNAWYPQGMNSGYPPFSYPGGPGYFNYPGGPGYFNYNSTAAPSRPGVQLTEEESRRRQEAAIRHGIAASVVRRPFGRRRSCTYRLIRLGIMLFLLGVTLLIVFGVLIVRPALNDTQLTSARCQVISGQMTGVDKSCDCGRYCSSKYPCLEIQVSYDADGEKNTAYLYKDVYADKNKVRTVFYFSRILQFTFIYCKVLFTF